MKTRIVVAMLLALMFGFWTGQQNASSKAYAQANPEVQVIPKSWGSLRGVMLSVLLFEDSSGNIRAYDTDHKKLIMEIDRR